MCGCGGNINRQVMTSNEVAAMAAQREAEKQQQMEALAASANAAMANAASE